MAVAELEAFSTENPGEYFTPQWDKWWFTVEYDPGKLTEWIPMAFATSYVFDGQGYWEYSAEIDYYEAGKDYSGYEFPADFATLTIMVDEDWEVVDHSIQTYKVLFSGPDDEEGTVLIDKTTKWFKPGDRVQFWNFGFNLNDETKDDWFESSDVITFTQEPRFLLELLEFEDEAGELIEYQYAMWAEDISGNGVLTELAFAEPEKGKRIRSRSGTDDVQRLLREGSCPQCDLRGAILMGVDLRDANLSGADLRDANLTTTILFRANLSGADLSGANLTSANLSGANLTSTNLSAANLGGAKLSGANLSDLDLGGANLTGANLRGAALTSTNLVGTDLSDANLVGTDLSDANLHGVDLRGVDLRAANLRGANLFGANLSGVDLRGADLSGADVGNVDLEEANLEVANLSGADLRGTDLGNVNLRLSDLRGANMFGVNLSGADLSGARFDATTKACDSKFLSRLLKIQFGIC